MEEEDGEGNYWLDYRDQYKSEAARRKSAALGNTMSPPDDNGEGNHIMSLDDNGHCPSIAKESL